MVQRVVAVIRDSGETVCFSCSEKDTQGKPVDLVVVRLTRVSANHRCSCGLLYGAPENKEAARRAYNQLKGI